MANEGQDELMQQLFILIIVSMSYCGACFRLALIITKYYHLYVGSEVEDDIFAMLKQRLPLVASQPASTAGEMLVR